ncbi:MAG: AAA family ATPase [Pseudomonadota bacterium]
MPQHHQQALAEAQEYKASGAGFSRGALTTYRGECLADGAAVEISLISARLPGEREKARLRHAYTMAQTLAGPHTVPHTGLVETAQGPLLIREQLDAIRLSELMLDAQELSLARKLGIAEALMTAVSHLHQRGVVHKDLQSDHLFWDAAQQRIVLDGFFASFSISSEHFEDAVDIESQSTLAYLAPECTGKLNCPVDVRADIYSCGALLYELFCGRPPFEFAQLRELLHAHVAYQPTPPAVMNTALPQSLSQIILKMLAKQPSVRYQTASGVRHDLVAVAAIRDAIQNDFALGKEDHTGRFVIPARLYGRDAELSQLMDAFQQCLDGRVGAFFVSGYSGVGKSSLVDEVQRPILTRHGWYGAGKFDQFRRDVPYQGWIAALAGLVEQLLAEPDEVLDVVKRDVMAALQGTAGEICQLLPAAELIVGEQSLVADDSPVQAQRRFMNMMGNFIKAVARPEHPVVLFLDDLQWADLASIALLESLIADVDMSSVLLLGAYRSNEVSHAHPLSQALKRIEKVAGFAALELGPLPGADLTRMIADTLLVEPAAAQPVAELVMQKTAGNPFFVKQYLTALFNQGVFTFDAAQSCWCWQLDEVDVPGATDNVVDLLSALIQRWPNATQQVVSAAACIGARFDLNMLSKTLQLTPQQVALGLQPALQAGLILPANADYRWVHSGAADVAAGLNPTYRFQHDKVQQSAHDLLPLQALSQMQYRIALARAVIYEAAEQGDPIAVMDHLAECVDEIEPSQRARFAAICLAATRRAKTSMATEPAWQYVQLGLRLLDAAQGPEQLVVGLQVDLQVECTEVAYLTGRFTEAQQAGALALQGAQSLTQRVLVHNALIGTGVAQRQHAQAVQYGLEVLRTELDIALPRAAALPQVLLAVAKTRLKLGRRAPHDLLALPEMQDADSQAAMNIMMKCATNAYWGTPMLVPAIASRMVELSMQAGNSGLAAYGYALYGMILSGAVNAVNLGYAFGQLAMDLLEKTGDRHLLGKTGLLFHGFIRHSLDPMSVSASETLALFATAMDTGDAENAYYCVNVAYYTDLLSGRRLADVEERYQPYLEPLLASGQEQTAYTTRCWMQTVHNLVDMRGGSRLSGSLVDWETDSQSILRDPSKQMESALVSSGAGWLAFLYGDWQRAERQFEQMYERRQSALGMSYLKPCLAMYAVVLAHNRPQTDIRAAVRLRKIRRQLHTWARQNPQDFTVFAQLLQAEEWFARGALNSAAGGWVDVAELARESGFNYLEAWAMQRAADVHSDLGHVVHARALDGRARLLWMQYGALGCVAARWGSAAPDTSPGLDLGHISRYEFATVLSSIQAVSSSVATQSLVEKILQLVVQIASARRAVLLTGGHANNILAVAELDQHGDLQVTAEQRSYAVVPLSLVDYVVRTQETVSIDDAQTHEWLSRDRYVLENQAKSMLAVPLLTHNQLVGVAVVENKLGAGLFSQAQTVMLESVLAQAAVALENARLYEAQTRRADAFRRFVPGNFLQILGRSDISEVEFGEAVERDATVMFADIRDFTQRSEQLGSSATFELLNRFFAAMNPLITQHGGFVDEYMGDGIKALFLQDVASAVQAAVDMQAALRRFNETNPQQNRLQIGIGLHLGPALLGTVGAAERMSTKAIGDTVNVAARVESLTKTYQVPLLITQSCVDALHAVAQEGMRQQNSIQTRLVAHVQLIGRSQPIAVHEVIEARPDVEQTLLRQSLGDFASATSHFFAGNFTAAAAGFAACLALWPKDELSRHYQRRCQQLIDAPPGPDWSGIEQQQAK